MTIYTVCRYNQARSIIGAAAIRKFYPEIEVQSAGVEANEGIPLPAAVLKVASEWGLAIEEKSSTLFSKIAGEIKSTDLVIAADSFVLDRIRDENPSGLIIDFARATHLDSLTAVDPAAMGQSDLRLELAKSVAASLLAAGEYLGTATKIRTVIPPSEEELPEIRKSVWEIARREGAFVIDASFRASEYREWVRIGAQVTTFGERFEVDQSLSAANGSVLAPAHEFPNAPKSLMSLEFSALVRGLGNSGPVYLVTPSAQTLSRWPDAALAAWHGPLLLDL